MTEHNQETKPGFTKEFFFAQTTEGMLSPAELILAMAIKIGMTDPMPHTGAMIEREYVELARKHLAEGHSFMSGPRRDENYGVCVCFKLGTKEGGLPASVRDFRDTLRANMHGTEPPR